MNNSISVQSEGQIIIPLIFFSLTECIFNHTYIKRIFYRIYRIYFTVLLNFYKKEKDNALEIIKYWNWRGNSSFIVSDAQLVLFLSFLPWCKGINNHSIQVSQVHQRGYMYFLPKNLLTDQNHPECLFLLGAIPNLMMRISGEDPGMCPRAGAPDVWVAGRVASDKAGEAEPGLSFS